MIEPPESLRDAAVTLASQGFRVFKLMVNGKRPAVKDFPNIASNDPKRVRSMWTDPVSGDELYNNIGILTGNDFLVVDVDVKDGKKGLESLDELIELGFDTDTMIAQSPTGSLHYYLALPDGREARNTVEKVGPGIDTRAHHGYVVAPPSITKDGVYEWYSQVEMLEAPKWLVDVVEKKEPPASDKLPQIDEDEPAIARAIEWLTRSAPEAIEGAGGNTQTYAVAAKLKDFGVAAPTATQLLIEHWNEHKAIPPWDPAELERVVDNAFQYGTSKPGISSAHADFYVVDIADTPGGEPSNPADKRKLFKRSYAEARSRALVAASDPLIKNFLDKHAFSVLYGESGVGKTFVALDIAFHIAAGLPWAGQRVTQGAVLYVAAEAGEDINARIEGLHRHYSPAEDPPFDVVPCLVDLFSPTADLKPLIELAGRNYSLIVVDTLARAMGTGDENSTQDMNVMVRHFDRLRLVTGSHVMVVHHSGKNKAAGARGSSALRAATDTEIEIADKVIEAKKQRARSTGEGIRFDLKGIEIGVDADGDRISTCVAQVRTAGEFLPVELTPNEQEWLSLMEAEALENVSVDNCQQSSNVEYIFTMEALQRIFSPRGQVAKLISEQSCRKRAQLLQLKGVAKKLGRNQWVLT